MSENADLKAVLDNSRELLCHQFMTADLSTWSKKSDFPRVIGEFQTLLNRVVGANQNWLHLEMTKIYSKQTAAAEEAARPKVEPKNEVPRGECVSREKYEELERKFMNLTQENNQLKEQRKSVIDIRKQMVDLEKTVKGWRDITDFANKLKSAEDKYKEAIDALETERNAKSTIIEDAERTKSRLEKENERILDLLEDARKEVDARTVICKKLSAKLTTLNKTIDELTKVVGEQKANMQKEIDRAKKAEAEREQMSRSLQGNDKSCTNLSEVGKLLEVHQRLINWFNEQEEMINTARAALDEKEGGRVEYIRTQILLFKHVKEMESEIKELKEGRINDIKSLTEKIGKEKIAELARDYLKESTKEIMVGVGNTLRKYLRDIEEYRKVGKKYETREDMQRYPIILFFAEMKAAKLI